MGFKHDEVIGALLLHLEKYAKKSLKFFPKLIDKSFDPFEYDLLKLDSDGMTTEYEVKTSINDFKNEFKKVKLKHSGKIKDIYKHSRFEGAESKLEMTARGKRANRYYFVIPVDVYQSISEEIPSIFGIYTYHFTNGRYHFASVRNALFLHYAFHLNHSMKHRLIHNYRVNNKADLNLKEMNDEELFWRCFLNKGFYQPRFRKTKVT